MSDFIQSANALVSRVAKWVGSIPKSTGITATAYNHSTGVITVSSTPVGTISVGDFVGINVLKGFAVVTAVSSGSITINDPDTIISSSDLPGVVLMLPTQSTIEITQAIQMGEMKMRKLELPALRTNPYDETNPTMLTTDANGMAPIPADMNWPILFFQETPNSQITPGTPAASLGPWIVYDRVGDREIIRLRMIDQLYVRPFGVPRVIRASFSEVGPNYVFTPNPGEGVQILAYYIQTFPFLYSPTEDVNYPLVQSNAVLASFPEGYFYATLWAYYDKNKNTDESQKWLARFEDSYGLIEDQMIKDKWSGGDRHLTSEYQPRGYRYNFK